MFFKSFRALTHIDELVSISLCLYTVCEIFNYLFDFKKPSRILLSKDLFSLLLVLFLYTKYQLQFDPGGSNLFS